MKSFSGDTDIVHEEAVPSEIRAYFSAAAARLQEEVWLRVETRWVAEGTPVQVTLYREDESGDREQIGEPWSGTIKDHQFEHKWLVKIEADQLEELHGALYFTFDAQLDGHPKPAQSQRLMVHRTRFSS